jgi:hypothetical protein
MVRSLITVGSTRTSNESVSLSVADGCGPRSTACSRNFLLTNCAPRSNHCGKRPNLREELWQQSESNPVRLKLEVVVVAIIKGPPPRK